MTLKDLCELAGSDNTPISLLLSTEHCIWMGTFPAMFLPTQYNDYKVKSVMPDANKDIFGEEEYCLKVWVEG